jgi:hypothetical protein
MSKNQANVSLLHQQGRGMRRILPPVTPDDVAKHDVGHSMNSHNHIKEWVLAAPQKLTKYLYQIIVEYKCVSRGWHRDGRYGSRTPKH